MKKIIIFLCVVICSICFETNVGAAESGETFYFEDGDVVGFIGDSITHCTYTSVSYVNVMNLYYISRFPEEQIEFRNIGNSGYKAVDVLSVYDQDPALRGINKAVIMLGTNEAILKYSTEQYINSMESLINRLKEDGIKGEDILVLSPPICDEEGSRNLRKN